MKLNYILSVVLACLIFSCDELEELIDKEVTITTSYTDAVTINIASEADPETDVNFRNGGMFDFLNNSDITEVIGTPEQIKKIEIVSIKYEYKDFSGNVDAQALNSFFFIATGFMNGESFPVQNEKIAEADLLGSVFNLTGDFSRVNNFITEGKLFSYLYEGNVSHNPAFFRVEITVTAKLTVEVNLDDI
ncbi:hypothetical protein [Algibacter sp. 2305UL17-15]|uniref:hypothetical protein n=1 Tax=Algibacter sp. 2305UL17-15 TaxID=3231268 RepID=UPI003458A520